MRRAQHCSGSGLDARRIQLAVELDAFIPQRIQLIDRDEVGWQARKVRRACMQWPSERVGIVLSRWIIDPCQRGHLGTGQRVAVVLAQGRKRLRRLGIGIGDVWAAGIDAVDVVEPAFLLGLERGGDSEIAAAGLA